jgi:hypothetical protein
LSVMFFNCLLSFFSFRCSGATFGGCAQRNSNVEPFAGDAG